MLFCVFVSSHHCFIAGGGGEGTCCSVYLSHDTLVLLQEVGARGHVALYICLITSLFYCRNWRRKDMLLCVFVSSHHCFIAGGGGKGHVALCICLITPLFYCRNWRRKDMLLCVFVSSHHCFIAGIGGERICCSVYLSHHTIVLLQEVGAKGHVALCICLITPLFYCRRWGRKDMLLCVFVSSHHCFIAGGMNEETSMIFLILIAVASSLGAIAACIVVFLLIHNCRKRRKPLPPKRRRKPATALVPIYVTQPEPKYTTLPPVQAPSSTSSDEAYSNPALFYDETVPSIPRSPHSLPRAAPSVPDVLRDYRR